MLDNGGLLKVAGFGMLRLSKIAPDKAKLAQADAHVDPSSMLNILSSGCFIQVWYMYSFC